jgi:transcriptional regulator with XRE-family HTH domain
VVVDDTSPIGARVRAIRVRQGMSLDALAAATGLSKAHLSRIERGERSLDRRSTLQTIADALRTPVEELTGQPIKPRNRAEIITHAAALDVRDVIMAAELGVDPGGSGRSGAALARELWRVERLREAADEAGFGPLLPGLLTDAYSLVAQGNQEAGLSLIIRCCFAVEQLSANSTGHHELAWIAAERALAAARLADDPTLVGAANVLRGLSLMHAGNRSRERALDIATRGAEELTRYPMTEDAAEVLGMLHLIAAFAHTAAERPGQAEDRLREALALAEYTGDGNAFGLWFGPTNVGAWRVWLAVEAGEGGAVAELAARVNETLLPPERRACMLIDVARGLARESDRHQDAVHMLVRAEALAPQRVHAGVFAREAIGSLLSAAGGTELRGLARRAGVA